jgi:hypothetical protein
VGSRNRATQLAEAILDDNAEAIFEKLVELSLAGRETMLKTAAERIVPRRARTPAFALPAIHTAADLVPAMDAIMRAAAEGAITPFDAAELARMVETALRALESGDFVRRRLDGFERRLAALAAVLRGWSRDAERESQERERHAILASVLRGGLEQAGLDPGEASALRHLEHPPAWLRPRSFQHPLRRLADRQRPRTLLDVLHEMTSRYHKGPPPSLRQASAMQLIGYYCFGAGNREAAAREAPA